MLTCSPGKEPPGRPDRLRPRRARRMLARNPLGVNNLRNAHPRRRPSLRAHNDGTLFGFRPRPRRGPPVSRLGANNRPARSRDAPRGPRIPTCHFVQFAGRFPLLPNAMATAPTDREHRAGRPIHDDRDTPSTTAGRSGSFRAFVRGLPRAATVSPGQPDEERAFLWTP